VVFKKRQITGGTTDHWLPGVTGEGRLTKKGQYKGILSDKTVLYLDCGSIQS
jgi:hypothetical protein